MKELFRGDRKRSHLLKDQFVFYLENVSLKFGNIRALNQITLKVDSGEILFVTGKSGAGKTTLLNVLAGDLKADSGKVKVGLGTNLHIAQVFQDLKLIPHATLEENLWVSYDRKIYKSRNEFYGDMMELVRVLGFENRLHLKIEKANGGLKQKVALVRALLTRPDVLIADEPTASLDKESSIKFFDVLNFYNVKRSLTVIWASHNRDLVKQFPGKIVHLENGKLIYSGHACFI